MTSDNNDVDSFNNADLSEDELPEESIAVDLLGRCLFAHLGAAISQQAAQFGEFGHREASGWGRYELVTPENAATHAVLTPAGFTPPPLPDLAALWALACAEWQ